MGDVTMKVIFSMRSHTITSLMLLDLNFLLHFCHVDKEEPLSTLLSKYKEEWTVQASNKVLDC
jgi:hypothetical protein